MDASGNAYTGEWQGDGGSAYQGDGDTLQVTLLPGMGGRGGSIDADGFVWAIDTLDAAHVLDPETREVEDARPPFVAPDAYSDMTNLPAPHGIGRTATYDHVFPPSASHPLHTSWPGTDVPDGAALFFRIRVAHTVDQLEVARWADIVTTPAVESPIEVYNAHSAAGVNGELQGEVEVAEIRVILRSSPEHDERPTLRVLWLSFTCAE